MATIPLGTKFIGLPSTYPTAEKRSAQVNAESGVYTMQDIIDTVGGGLGGTQYVFVAADGTDVQNAAELQAAYVTAAQMSPSASNRITVIAAPGNYNFNDNFVMDAEYIDLVSLDGNRSIVFNGAGTIIIDQSNIFIKGVDVGTKSFGINNQLDLLRIENCRGADNSFGGAVEIMASSIFIDCTGGDGSFGGNGGTANGTFTGCIGGGGSFGGNGGGTASGTFTNCTGGDYSFGDGGTASGTFTDCQGGYGSFGGDGGTASGVFINCQSGSYSFGGDGGTASGTFTNCTGGDYSFGDGGTLSGFLYYCRITSGTFATVSGGGRTVLCIDGSNNQNNQ
jgi:hypothetical protein